MVKESEAGGKKKDVCRRQGISEATLYNWKTKYTGMTVSEARRLRELEAENSKLKRLFADAARSRLFETIRENAVPSRGTLEFDAAGVRRVDVAV